MGTTRRHLIGATSGRRYNLSRSSHRQLARRGLSGFLTAVFARSNVYQSRFSDQAGGGQHQGILEMIQERIAFVGAGKCVTRQFCGCLSLGNRVDRQEFHDARLTKYSCPTASVLKKIYYVFMRSTLKNRRRQLRLSTYKFIRSVLNYIKQIHTAIKFLLLWILPIKALRTSYILTHSQSTVCVVWRRLGRTYPY